MIVPANTTFYLDSHHGLLTGYQATFVLLLEFILNTTTKLTLLKEKSDHDSFAQNLATAAQFTHLQYQSF